MADVIELTQDPKARERPKEDFAPKDDGPTQRFRTCVGNVLDKVVAVESSLNEWGSSVGDKDFGTAATSASKAAKESLNEYDFKENLQEGITKFSETFADAFGGASGPLWRAFMSGGAILLNKKLSENTGSNWTAAYEEGLKAVKELSGAQKGQRTIVDALEAGMEYVNALDAENPAPYLEDLAKAIRSGALAAKSMRGFKQYCDGSGDKLVGLPDPGCELVALVAETAATELS